MENKFIFQINTTPSKFIIVDDNLIYTSNNTFYSYPNPQDDQSTIFFLQNKRLSVQPYSDVFNNIELF